MANDLLILNGNVWTGDPANPRADAVAIANGKIVLAGSAEAARGAVGRDADVIDAGGRTVLPGLIDAHNHYLATAEAARLGRRPLPGGRLTRDLTRVIGRSRPRSRRPGAGFAPSVSTGPSSRTAGCRRGTTSTRPPWLTRSSSTTSPSTMRSSTPAAMRDARHHRAVPDPPGGKFVRDEAGRLTGLCLDSATDLILPVELDIGCHGPNFHTDPAAARTRWRCSAAASRDLPEGRPDHRLRSAGDPPRAARLPGGAPRGACFGCGWS